MPGHLDFDFRFGRAGRPRDADAPMRLLLLGDFSGRPAEDRPPLATRPARAVDIDTLDTAMRQLAPRLQRPAGEIQFARLDDFHPDRLYTRLDLFQALRQARQAPPPAAAGDLGRLLGKAGTPGAAPAASPAGGIEALIRDIVAPHIVADTSAETNAYRAAVDSAIAEQMRMLLHDQAFQALEGAWRGVHWLVSNLELDDSLQLHLFDVARAELLADVAGASDGLPQSGLYRALVDRSRNVPGGARWSCLVALMQFGTSDDDAGLLEALGTIASEAGAPLLAGADPALAGGGDERPPHAWRALRRTGTARWIGLAAPRLLLRLPYGRNTDPIDAFAFEEISGAPAPDELLWGSGSLALALLSGRAFTARGWEMTPGDERDIDGLPAYTFLRDGEPELQACAERYLTESEIQRLLDAGLIPLASRRDRNAVVAIRFQSIADPPAPLAW